MAARRRRSSPSTLALLEERLEPGITMAELDRIADEYIRSHGGVPTSKGYKGFPAAICISPNDMIVHGIPGDYRAQEGDIISFDVGVTKDGLIADSAATFPVGEISAEAQRLLDVCQAALEAGIEAAQRRRDRRRHLARPSRRRPRTPGSRSCAASSATASAASTTRTRRCRTSSARTAGPELREGMTLAIEPMITAGGPEVVRARRRAGRSRPSTARSRPISSTRSRSPPRARGCSRDAQQVLVP